MAQPATCPECGALHVNGLSCWEQLGAILAWEYGDPELLAEHFFTVACYNLQHPAQYTEDALAGLRAALRERLDHGVAVAHLRHQAARAYSGSKRVRKPAAERQPVLHQWTMTIAAVYLPNQPQGAADRVRAWAMAIRAELGE